MDSTLNKGEVEAQGGLQTCPRRSRRICWQRYSNSERRIRTKNCRPLFKKRNVKPEGACDPETEAGVFLAILLEVSGMPQGFFYFLIKRLKIVC